MSNKVGRPSKLTKDRRESILQSVFIGLSFKMACEIAGISACTLATWRKNKPQFLADMQRAESHGIQERLKRISSHANEDWKADAWILSHRHPNDFSERRIIKVEEKNTSPFDRLLDAIAKRDETDKETEPK